MVAFDTNSLVTSIRQRHKLGDGVSVGVKAGMPASVQYDNAHRELMLIANTADVDLEREVVVPQGCLQENGGSQRYFLANRKILWGHDYGGMAVGQLRRDPALRAVTSPSSGKVMNAWLCRVTLMRTPEGEAIRLQAEDGAFPASSIGFEAMSFGDPTREEVKAYGDHDSIVRTWHWLELSLTHMPCNAACQSVTGYDPEKAMQQSERWVSTLGRSVGRGLVATKTAERLGLPMRRLWPTVPAPTKQRKNPMILLPD